MIKAVPAQDLHAFEQFIREVLQKCPMEDMDTDDVLGFLASRDLQAWIIGNDSVLITEIVKHPKHTILVLKYGAGKISRAKLEAARAVVFPWAKSYGCTKVEVAGRKGWARVLGLTQEIPLMRGELQ